MLHFKQTGQTVSQDRLSPPGAPVRVDVEACERLALLLSSQKIPLDAEDTALPGFLRNEIGNFYFLLVAICHQTSPRGKLPLEGTVDGRKKRGWDYLSAKLELAVRKDRSLLGPSRWADLEPSEFASLFRDEELGDRLTEIPTRTLLVQDLGHKMLRSHWVWLEDLFKTCRGRVKNGTPNFFGLLGNFAAYRDPVRKKSSFLLALMKNSVGWKYADEENLGPPVDYHEVRGHLRIGTVVVTNSDLRQKLLAGLPVTAEDDIAIRSAVYDAIMLLSEFTGLRNPSQLHYLFWNVFRAHCRRESPRCYEPAPDLPDRYQHLAVHGQDRCCPFSSVCMSASATQRYYEHVFDTDFY